MGFFDRFRKKEEKIDLNAQRIEFLRENGRITDGTIIDTETLENGDEIAYYFYSVQGVDFESSEILTAEQRNDGVKYAPGAKIGVKFDPRNHANSILV